MLNAHTSLTARSDSPTYLLSNSGPWKKSLKRFKGIQASLKRDIQPEMLNYIN